MGKSSRERCELCLGSLTERERGEVCREVAERDVRCVGKSSRERRVRYVRKSSRERGGMCGDV